MLKTLLIAAATVVFAGGSQAPGSKACALLSTGEIQETLDATVGAGETRLNSEAAASCRFAGKNGASLAILVRRIPREPWTAEQIARMERGVRAGSYRDVPGIGERSFLLDMRQAGAALCVFQGGFYLQISAVRMGDASRVSAGIERLARKALARM